MLKLIKYLDPVINLFCFSTRFGFLKEVSIPVVFISTFQLLFCCEMEFIQNNHNHTKISKYLHLTGKNKFIG